MFLAMVVEHYAERFEENGALCLNHMIQERSGFNREEAWALVADAIGIGLLWVEKELGKKKLRINQKMFDEWKGNFVFQLPKIKASVVSSRWTLKRSDRKLTNMERAIVQKNIRKGRLFEIQKDIAKDMSNDLEIPWDII